MTVKIGEVATFPNVEPSKAQALKVLEEASEIVEETKKLNSSPQPCATLECQECPLNAGECILDNWHDSRRERIIDECADVIQATCNLLAALGVDDMREAMRACEARNRERGRL